MSTEPFRIPCPSCGKSLKTASEPAAGSRLKCPKCQTEFRYQRPGAAEAPQPSPRPAVTVQPAVVVQPAASQPTKGRGAGFPLAMVLLLGLLICVAAGGGIIVYRSLQSDKPPVVQGGSGEDDEVGDDESGGGGGGEDDPQADAPSVAAFRDAIDGDDEEADEPAEGEGGEETDPAMDEGPSDEEPSDDVSTEPLDGRPRQFASAAAGDLLLPPVEHPAQIVDIEFSPKGDKLAAICGAGYATIWDVKSKRATNVTFQSLGGSIVGPFGIQTQIRYTSDGKLLVFGTTNCVVVADVASGKSKWQSEGGFKAGRLIVSGNGQTVLVNPVDFHRGASKGADIIDTATGNKLAERQQIDSFSKPAFSPDGRLLALVENERVRLFDVNQKRDAKVVRGVYANDLAMTPDSKTLVVSANSAEIQIWDLSGDEPGLSGTIENREFVRSMGSGKLTISPDGMSLAIGSNLFDLPSGQKRAQVEGLIEGDFSGDSRFIAGLTTKRGDEQNVVVADAATGRIVEVFDMGMLRESSYRDALCVALSPDGQLVAVGSGDGSITLHAVAEKAVVEKAAGGGELASFKLEVPDHLLEDFDSRKQTFAYDLGFSPDAERVVTRGTWTTVWDIEGGAQQVLMPGPDEGYADQTRSPSGGSNRKFGFDPEGALPVGAKSWMFRNSDQALVVSNGSLLGQYERTLGTPQVNKADSTVYRLVKGSPRGDRVAAIISDRERGPNALVLLDPQNGKVQSSLWLSENSNDLSGELFERINFSNDGKLLALALSSSEVKVWETDPVRERPTTAANATAVAFLQQGHSLVAIAGTDTAKIYEIGTGQLKYDLDLSRGHTGAVGAVAFSDLAPVFASGDSDGTLLIRDPKTGDVKARVDAHGAPIIAAGFSADGTRLATAAAGFSADGTRQATAVQDFTVKVWDVAKLLGAGGGQGGQ